MRIQQNFEVLDFQEGVKDDFMFCKKPDLKGVGSMSDLVGVNLYMNYKEKLLDRDVERNKGS